VNGYSVSGIPRIVPVKYRVAGLRDAIIEIDGDAWDEMSDAKRRALLDHQLCHFDVQKDKDGNIKLDDCNRPVLKIKPHDWQVGGFDAVSQRHGSDALEVEAADRLEKHLEQKLLFDPSAAA
jgi:hypothetical protein